MLSNIEIHCHYFFLNLTIYNEITINKVAGLSEHWKRDIPLSRNVNINLGIEFWQIIPVNLNTGLLV